MAVQNSDNNNKCLESAVRATQRDRRPGWFLGMEVTDRFPICCLENCPKNMFLCPKSEEWSYDIKSFWKPVTSNVTTWDLGSEVSSQGGTRTLWAELGSPPKVHCCSKESPPHLKPCLLWKITAWHSHYNLAKQGNISSRSGKSVMHQLFRLSDRTPHSFHLFLFVRSCRDPVPCTKGKVLQRLSQLTLGSHFQEWGKNINLVLLYFFRPWFSQVHLSQLQ